MIARRISWSVWCSAAACLIACGGLAQSAPDWTVFKNESNTAVLYPSGIFTLKEDAADANPPGDVFTTSDRRAWLHIFVYRNDLNESPAQHLKRVFPRDRRVLNYDRVASRFFAISENKEDRILYRRCNFTQHLIHCIDLNYPRSEKRAWDDIVTRISRSPRPR